MATFFHRTTLEAAKVILEHRFRDGRGHYGMEIEVEGVWISNVPLEESEGATGDVVLEITLDEREIVDYEVVEEGKPYREWVVPAVMINTEGSVRLLSDEEAETASMQRCDGYKP